MHLAMKIQPIGFEEVQVLNNRQESVNFKSRFKKLFDRQFLFVSEISAPSGKTAGGGYRLLPCERNNNGLDDVEPSSIFLDNMIQNFMEESVDHKQPRGIQSRFNCFNGNVSYSSDEDLTTPFDRSSGESYLSTDACENLKSLVPCACVLERNLLADTARIVENNKIYKRKNSSSMQIVVNGLLALGYDASICKSHWEKSSSFPAGEYEYMDVRIEGKRVIIDIDFRSEFEIARSTKAYKSIILQVLPIIFVGKADRLEKIITIVSEAAKQSMKKKGMHFPPWRKAEYVKSKWLSPYIRTCDLSNSKLSDGGVGKEEGQEEKKKNADHETEVKQWELPLAVVKSRSLRSGCKISSGIASVLEN